MPDVASRKRDELRRKLQGLPLELKYWMEESEAGRPHEKHYRQIRRLVPQMLQLHDPIAQEFENLTSDAGLLTECRRLEMRILAVHTVWDYFRSKFVMRAQEPFASFLKTADAFAWACYGPAQEMYKGEASEDLREPPLVALQNNWSPSALPRGKMYNVMFAPGGWTNTKPFIDVIQALPVPILGLPWLQVQHLPHVVMLAHEVGHVIEFDLNAQPKIVKAIADAKVDANRKAGWESWESELFADWFGCYAAGPAFVWALSELLAMAVDTVVTETKDDGWGAYPTATLRMRFNQAVLRRLGWTTEAAEIGSEWDATYPAHGMKEFERDVDAIAVALLDARLAPASLCYNLRGDEAYLRAVLQGTDRDTDLPDSITDPRGPIALAGALHRESPVSPIVKEQWQRLRDHIVRIRPKGVLAGEAVATIGAAELKGSLVASFFDGIDEMEKEAILE
jgi:hypothetical protein